MENFKKLPKINQICIAGVMAALIFVVAWLIKIPVPLPTFTGAYMNLGDCVIFIAAYMMGGVYGAAAAGIGSALADTLGGATQYILATLVIKALMALVFAWISKKGTFTHYILAAAAAGLVMVAGYGIFEWLMFGWAVCVASVPYNLIQMAGNLVVALPLYSAVKYLHKLVYRG